MPSKHPKPSRQPAAEWREQLACATVGLPVREFVPLKPKPVADGVQARMDSYRAIRSLMP